MRLIDADDLLTAFPYDDEPTVTKASVRATINHMPTIHLGSVEICRWFKSSEVLPELDRFGMSKDVFYVGKDGKYGVGFRRKNMPWVDVQGVKARPMATPIYWCYIPKLTN